MDSPTVGVINLPIRSATQADAAARVAEAMRNGTSREVKVLQGEVTDLNRKLCELREDMIDMMRELNELKRSYSESNSTDKVSPRKSIYVCNTLFFLRLTEETKRLKNKAWIADRHPYTV